MKRICLVSPGPVASNPRLVKEANALHSAGFQVRVISGNSTAIVHALNATILSEAPWSWVQVDLGNRLGYLGCRFWQELARSVANTGWIPHLSVATWAHSPMSARLAKVAAAQPADLYIAHCLAALPAAAYAAQKHNARLGFDAEDFHVGELPKTPSNLAETAIRDYLERTLLPRCQHLTAASSKIATAYAERYGISMEPILNVFPLSEAPTSPQRLVGDRIGKEPSLYWFSQTIGPGRGLEAIVQAMGRMRTLVRLHLRGTLVACYKDKLMSLAQEVGVGERIHLLPPAPPSEMARLAACHDIGLSVEPGRDTNNNICLGNKIFTYLLAGLPVLMSRTPAQEEFATNLGEAAALVNINNPEEIALTLDKWLSDVANLELARSQAWKLGQENYNWNKEQHRFLSVVERALK